MSEATLAGSGRRANLSELNLFHKNPRVGNVDVIKASLRAHSQYKPVVVNKGTHTGRPNEILAGNHTVKAIRDLAEENPDDERWATVDVWEIDVDDDRAGRIVVADNRTSELGHTDEEALLELLQDLEDLDGTGYEDEDLDDLVALLQENEEDEAAAAEGEQKEKREDGLIDADDLETRGDKYAEGATRMVILTLGIEQFVWIQEKLEAYRKEFTLPTNTDVMLHLIENWSGETAPEAEDPGDGISEDLDDALDDALDLSGDDDTDEDDEL